MTERDAAKLTLAIIIATVLLSMGAWIQRFLGG